MSRIKTAAAILLILAGGIPGGLLNSALGANPTNYVYYGNQLIEVDFDDGSFIIYEYDGNGNLVSKTPGGSGTQSYTITTSIGSGSGMISPSEPNGIKVVSGSNYTFTIIPDTGSCITNVMVDGSRIGSPESYTFTNVQANHSISATFAACTFPITVTVNGSGTVSPNPANVAYGGSQAFTITPNADVYVDGYYQGNIGSVTISNVIAPHSLTANFQTSTYTISTSVIGGGTITPASATVNYGGQQTFTISPPQGITSYDVQADGVSMGPLATYTFTDVTGNHALCADFSAVKNTRTNLTYSSLNAAYGAAQSGDSLLALAGILTENFTANQNISVTIDGGYSAGFGSNQGATTTIRGQQTIGSGTVTWKNFEISH
jgi:YD repeat-containing protein